MLGLMVLVTTTVMRVALRIKAARKLSTNVAQKMITKEETSDVAAVKDTSPTLPSTHTSKQSTMGKHPRAQIHHNFRLEGVEVVLAKLSHKFSNRNVLKTKLKWVA